MKTSVGAVIARCWLIAAWLAITFFAAFESLCYIDGTAEVFCDGESWAWVTELPGFVAVTGLLLLMPHSSLGSRAAWPLHASGAASLLLCVLSWLKGRPLEGRDPFRRFLVITGCVTGRNAEIHCGLLLLAVARRSTKVNLDGLGYVDMLPFHRAVGWWCAAMVTVHSLAFSGYYLARGGWTLFWQACFPVPTGGINDSMNTLGLVNFFGVVSFLCAIGLGVFSMPRVRRAAYDKFYIVHLVTASGFILFACLHYIPWVWFSLPGIAFYAYDRWMARRSRRVAREVTARILVDNGLSSIALLTWNGASPSGPKPGHRWASICVTNVSAREWHPFSVIQHKGQTHVMIKGLGDWSQSLCRMVSEQATLNIRVEGLFGRTLSTSNRQARNLFLIAGGVGVSPHVDLLCGIREHAGAKWETTTLLWAVRHREYTAMSSKCVDLAAISQAARVLVFVTDQPAPSEESVTVSSARSPESAACAPGAKPFHAKAGFVLACLPAIACVAAVAYSFEPLLDYLDAYSKSLITFAIAKRLVPVLVALCLCFPGAIGVAIMHALLSRVPPASVIGNAGPESQQRLTADERPANEVLVTFAKPDLHSEVAREAELGPMEVHVCGPSRMIEAVRCSVRTLRRAGFEVALDVHDPDL